jgi:hypothetical protein
MPPVDIDRPETWPQEIATFVESWASQCRGSASHVSDLSIPLEVEDEFRRLLINTSLKASGMDLGH